jgi:hypothetical protein
VQIGLETAPLRVVEVISGELEVAKVCQCLANALEPLGKACGERAERRCAPARWPHHPKRVVQQLPALGLSVGGAPCADQRHALVHLQPVAHDRGHDALLLSLRDRAERMRQRRADDAGVDLLLHLGSEMGRQRQPRGHPLLLAAGKLGDAGDGQAIVLQRGGHARLVHRRHRARRSVGCQDRGLRLMQRLHRLDDDRHRGATLAPPALQTLEAVHHLEAAVFGARCAQR